MIRQGRTALRRPKRKRGWCTLGVVLFFLISLAVMANLFLLHMSDWGGGGGKELGLAHWIGHRGDLVGDLRAFNSAGVDQRSPKLPSASALPQEFQAAISAGDGPRNGLEPSQIASVARVGKKGAAIIAEMMQKATEGKPSTPSEVAFAKAEGNPSKPSEVASTTPASESSNDGGGDDDGGLSERQGPWQAMKVEDEGGTVADEEEMRWWHDDDRGELSRPGLISYAAPTENQWISNVTWREEGARDPWPFYRIGIEEGTGSDGWPWPGVGWLKRRGGQLKGFDEYGTSFKFYMYDDVPYSMAIAERCYRDKMKLDDDWHNLDRNVRLMQREHFSELWLLEALRRHPLRTLDADQADLFVVGYTPCLAKFVQPCDNVLPQEQWEDAVADALAGSPHWKRKSGADHLLIHMKYGIRLSKKLNEVMDNGHIVLSIDRDYWLLMRFMRKSYTRGSVLIMPYVSSTFLDVQQWPSVKSEDKDPESWFFFRGTLKRKHGGQARPILKDLGELLRGADFAGVVLNKHDGSIFTILNETSVNMRKSSICLCPEGDSPTSLRVFEALASGCVPLIMVDRIHMATNLPFPSIIEWDEIALFAHPLGRLSHRKDGLLKTAQAIEIVAGRDAGPEAMARLDKMREKGRQVYDKFFSYLRNPSGIADGMLFEAWVQVQRKGVLQGPYHNPRAMEIAKKRNAPPASAGGKNKARLKGRKL